RGIADSQITQRCPSHPSTAWSRSPGMGGRDQVERMVAINRNRWSQSAGAPMLCYMKYYNGARTHLSLEKDAPISRAVELAGHILSRPILGGLHHRYARI